MSTKELDQIGFGTYRIVGDDCYNSVLSALKCGYRTIDTATLYKNHKEISKAIRDSQIDRNEIFIISKIHRKYIKSQRIFDGFESILEELDISFIDLLLLHEPLKNKNDMIEDIQNIENWKQMEIIAKTNKARYIGVSNFNVRQLKNIVQNCSIKPYCNQIELSPFCTRESLVKYCEEIGIKIQAYRSLLNNDFDNIDCSCIKEISGKYSCDVYQVLLSWALNKQYYIIPSSTNLKHITDNFIARQIKLSIGDVEKLDKLNIDYKTMSQHSD